MLFKVPFTDLNIGLGDLLPIESIKSFSFVDETFAAVGPPHNCHPNIPAGGCQTTTFPDDDPSDGLQAKVTLCVQFPACFWTYFVPLQAHININVADYANPNNQQMSFVNCMRSHNSGTNFMRNPANLTIHWWLNDNVLAPSCANQIACGCANGTDPAPIPRVSRNRTMHVSQACDANNWGAVRHELAHTYGYDHCEMDLAFDKVADCINGSGKSPTGSTCTACAPCKVCNDNGQNVFTRPCQAPYMPLHDHRVLP